MVVGCEFYVECVCGVLVDVVVVEECVGVVVGEVVQLFDELVGCVGYDFVQVFGVFGFGGGLVVYCGYVEFGGLGEFFYCVYEGQVVLVGYLFDCVVVCGVVEVVIEVFVVVDVE